MEISSEHPENVTEVGTGTYHFPGSVVCKAKDYPYAEYTQQDVLTISASEHLMGSAPSFSWTVAGEAITDISGTLTVAVPATILQPGDLPGKNTESRDADCDRRLQVQQPYPNWCSLDTAVLTTA